MQEITKNQEQSSWTKNNPLGFSLSHPMRTILSMWLILLPNNPRKQWYNKYNFCIRVWIDEIYQSLDWSSLSSKTNHKDNISAQCVWIYESIFLKYVCNNVGKISQWKLMYIWTLWLKVGIFEVCNLYERGEW